MISLIPAVPYDPMQTIWELILSGGFAMWPLAACSIIVWVILLERAWTFYSVSRAIGVFHSEALQSVLTLTKGPTGQWDTGRLKETCTRHAQVPTAQLVQVGLERKFAADPRLSAHWRAAVDRRRQQINLELRKGLSLLGTLGSAAPFIGLFGTVVGILRSFQSMARTGAGGFNVVAGGISESLIATAAGIIVAVIAVMAYNALQTRLSLLVLQVRHQSEELLELIVSTGSTGESHEVRNS